MTELEAVNIMLQAIGEQRVNSVKENGESDLAYSILIETNKKIQMKGWSFNEEFNFELTPDVNKKINIPDNLLNVDILGDDTTTIRGKFLYNKEDHTYEFDGNIEANVIVLLPFEEVVYVFQNYIVAEAAYSFQKNTLGNSSLLSFSLDEIDKALYAVQKFENKLGSYNMLNNLERS